MDIVFHGGFTLNLSEFTFTLLGTVNVIPAQMEPQLRDVGHDSLPGNFFCLTGTNAKISPTRVFVPLSPPNLTFMRATHAGRGRVQQKGLSLLSHPRIHPAPRNRRAVLLHVRLRCCEEDDRGPDAFDTGRGRPRNWVCSVVHCDEQRDRV